MSSPIITDAPGPLGHQYRLYIYQNPSDGWFRFKMKDMTTGLYHYFTQTYNPAGWAYGYALSVAEIYNQCDNADASIRDLWRQASDYNWWAWDGPTGARAAFISVPFHWKRVPQVANTGKAWNSDCKIPTYVCNGVDYLGF